MKRFLTNPKAYILAVLALLPLQVLIVTSASMFGTLKMVATMKQQPDQLQAAIQSATKLEYMFYGSVAVDMALLVAALILLNRTTTPR